MAWWDSEELKPLEYRSESYFKTFQNEYTAEDAKKWKEVHSHSQTKRDILKMEDKDKSMTDKEMFDMTWNKPWTKATEENWAGDVKYLYRDHGWDDTGTYSLQQAQEIRGTGGLGGMAPPPAYKFNEDELLCEVREYIDQTYALHYGGQIQSFEKIEADGHADGFALGNIDKLVSRYGKKKGYNREDLLKIIHYGILLLWVHSKTHSD